MAEDNPVKEILYNYLNKFGDNKIQRFLSEKKSSELIEQIISHCYPEIKHLGGNGDENICTLLTGMLHYLLTNSLIPSQRKIELDGIELDIVIPDLKTLKTKPKNALVLHIPKHVDESTINRTVNMIQTVQPNKENIWIIQKELQQPNIRTFEINNNSITQIIDEINGFLSKTKQTQFKIFKSNLV